MQSLSAMHPPSTKPQAVVWEQRFRLLVGLLSVKRTILQLMFPVSLELSYQHLAVLSCLAKDNSIYLDKCVGLSIILKPKTNFKYFPEL